MAWPIAEVARMSGVTARALRHYDQIGLLRPAFVGGNGHRYYEDGQLLRLQQILLLRELGLGLTEIGGILSAQVDELELLRSHHQRLVEERKRLDTLARTVARTIVELQRTRKEGTMPEINRPENLFEGFDTARIDADLRTDFPEWAEQAERLAASTTLAEAERGQRERTAVMVRMAEFMVAGTPVTDPEVQAEIDGQYRAFTEVRPVSAEEFRAIGRSVVDNDHWRAAYETIATGLAEYQREAILTYADTRLV
ncbi:MULTISPECIES: MerR family transcriptional regulator [Kitasatospora]|uniref:MerR family transcriptional regulator n=1 Tax=Kitasatospora cystarginea TaxID=58350 RepID=A0ABN3E2G9_9ACTN